MKFEIKFGLCKKQNKNKTFNVQAKLRIFTVVLSSRIGLLF